MLLLVAVAVGAVSAPILVVVDDHVVVADRMARFHLLVADLLLKTTRVATGPRSPHANFALRLVMSLQTAGTGMMNILSPINA